MKINLFFNRFYQSVKFIINHPLIINERLNALLRYLIFHIRYRNGQICKIPFLNQHLVIKKGAGGQANYYTYMSDFEEMAFILHYLDQNDNFIDIGANIGAYSILVGSQIGCNTLSFEPSIPIYKLLKLNVQLNKLKDIIKPYNFALGSENEVKTIGYKGELTYLTNNKQLDLQKVSVKKLDDMVNFAECIKVDVEGYEELVLKGASKILDHPNTNVLIIELADFNRYGSSNQDVHNYIIKKNYIPIKYEPFTRTFIKLSEYRSDQLNTIYIRNDELVEGRLMGSPKYKIGNQWI